MVQGGHRAAGQAPHPADRRPARRLADHPGQDRAPHASASTLARSSTAPSRRSGRSIEERKHELAVVLPAAAALVRGRPDPARAGPRQPPDQRRQVHRRRAAISGSPPRHEGERGRRPGPGRRHRHRRRDRSPGSSSCSSRATGRSTAPGRPGHRPDAGADARRAARRAASTARARGRARAASSSSAAGRPQPRRPRPTPAAAEPGGQAKRLAYPRRRRQRGHRPGHWPSCSKLLGHDVRVAHDGPTAIDEAAAFRPEVVLLDIGLPGMDGYEVARRSAARRPRRTPSSSPSPATARRRTAAAPRGRLRPPPGQARRLRRPPGIPDRTAQRVINKNPHPSPGSSRNPTRVRPLLRRPTIAAPRLSDTGENTGPHAGRAWSLRESPGFESTRPRRSAAKEVPSSCSADKVKITNALGLHLRAAPNS